MARWATRMVVAIVAVAGVALPWAPSPVGAQGAPDPSTLPSSGLRELFDGSGVSPDGQSIADGRVTVEVLHDLPDAAAVAVVEANGGVVSGSVPGELVQAEVPLDALTTVQAAPGVRLVRLPGQVALPEGTNEAATPGGAAAAVTGAQVAKTNVDDWHAEGWTGAGVKVGIIDAFDQTAWDAAQAAGEVPAPSGTFCRFLGFSCTALSTGDDHGVGVAEIIADLAPDAELYLAVVYSAADLQAAVDWFATNGVTVINRSQTAEYDGPGDGTGPTAAVVDDAVANGMLWANAAGNASGTTGNSGEYLRTPWQDPDGDGYLDFSPGPGEDEVMEVRCAFTNGVRWSDWDADDPTDYDVEVYADEALTTLVGTSTDDQGAGAPPLELLNLKLVGKCTIGSQYVYVRIKLADEGGGTNGDILEMMGNQSRFEYWQNPYAASAPMVDSANPGLLAVGAVDPAAGTTIAPYSSWGPTNDGRTKPDLSAASCVTTLTTGAGCFNGTSAASPTTAGAAAVVMSSGLHSEPADVADYLRTTAVDRGAVGTDTVYGTGEVVLPAPPPAGPTGEVHTVDPDRILDTRSGLGAPDAPVGAKTSIDVDVLGVGGVPETGVDAVVLNVTGLTTDATHLTVWPAGAARPQASSLNLGAGETAANLVTVKVGDGGAVSVFNNAGTTEVIADVVGWVDDGSVEGGEVVPVDPARLLDTRTGLGAPSGPVGPGGSVDLAVTGAGGVPPTGAAAVLVNVTAVAPTVATHVTVHATGQPLPGTSNLNLAAGATRPNLVLVPVGAGGAIRLTNESGSVHLLADVVGWVDDGTGEHGELTVQSPQRVIDTRIGLGPSTVGATMIGDAVSGPPLRREWRAYDLDGVAGLPADGVTAVLVNVTVVGAPTPSHVALVPGRPSAPPVRPGTSNLNVAADQTAANAVLVPLDENGELTVFSETRGESLPNVVVDVVGWVS